MSKSCITIYTTVDHYGFANRDHTLITGLREGDVVELKEFLLRFEKKADSVEYLGSHVAGRAN